MLYFLSCSLQLRVVAFSEIEKKEECEIVFFYNSSVPEQVKDLESFRPVESEVKRPDCSFYAVDAADPANAQVFSHDIFETMPRVFVMLPEERFSEPMIDDFELQKAKEYVHLKLEKIDPEKYELVKDAAEINKTEAFVYFTAANCSVCQRAMYSVQRVAQHYNVPTKVVNCSQMSPYCEEVGVYNVPTVWYVLDNVPSQVQNYLTGWCVKEYEAAHGADRELRKTRKIEKQPAPEERQKELPIIPTQARVDSLEKRLKQLEKEIEKLTGKKTEL